MNDMFARKDLHCHIMEPYALCPSRDYVQPGLQNARQIGAILEKCGLEALAIPAITLYEEPDFACNSLSLYAKLLHPGRVYALAGIRRYAKREENRDMERQAGRLMEAGFDGFKMICKPNARRVMQFPIDDMIFEAFYEAAEREQWPILFHVGDPASFWDRKQAPDWAVENDWYYGEDTQVPSYEALYREVEAVLARHPGLRITFAHFFFTSHDLGYASGLLDKYPNVCFDVTPGSEMYLDFAQKPEEARLFFQKYRERLLFGTDNAATAGPEAENLKGCLEKVERMRRFFETREELCVEGRTVRGLGLDARTLSCLYSENFEHFFHNREPAPVNTDRARELAEEMMRQMKCETHEAVKTKELLEELARIFGGKA